MNKVLTIAIALIVSTTVQAGDLGLDFSVKVDAHKGTEARVGIDLFKAMSKTGAAETTTTSATTSSSDKGMFKRIGSWVSENPWKAGLITAAVIYGGYAAYDNNKGSSSNASGSTSRDDQSDNRGVGINLADITVGDDLTLTINNFSMPFEEE